MKQMTQLLIVEDNPLDRMLLRMALKEVNWPLVVTEAHDGEQAIALLESSEPPDFVVLDLNLPRRDGSEVLSYIRTNATTAHTPVAVVSSSPTDVIEHRLTRAGVTANYYLTKPETLDDFLQLGQMLLRCFKESRTEDFAMTREHSAGEPSSA